MKPIQSKPAPKMAPCRLFLGAMVALLWVAPLFLGGCMTLNVALENFREAGIAENRGLQYFSEKHFEEAEKAFTDAILWREAGNRACQAGWDCELPSGVWSGMAQSYVNRGVARVEQNKMDLAREDARSALGYNDKSATAHFLLGRIYIQSGDFDAARREIETLKTLNTKESMKFADNLADNMNYLAAEREREAPTSGRQLMKLLGKYLTPFGSTTHFDVSPDAKLIAAGTLLDGVNVWDVATGVVSHTLNKGGIQVITAVTFSADGRWLASADTDKNDRTITLWEVATGKEVRTFASHAQGLTTLVFRPDGRQLASGSEDGTITLWDVATGKKSRTLTGHTDKIYYAVFSTDGRWLATTSEDGTIKMWEVATGHVVHTLRGQTGIVFAAMTFSPDGRWLASGGNDNNIRLWNVATGQLVRTLAGHGDQVACMAFSSDGRWLTTASWDKTVKRWEVATGQPRKSFSLKVKGEIKLGCSPDVSYAFAIDDSGVGTVWDASTGKLMSTLPAGPGRPPAK